jgi:hypothetical protein
LIFRGIIAKIDLIPYVMLKFITNIFVKEYCLIFMVILGVNIFLNRDQIKKEIRLKNKVIPILTFMIERGSIQSYLLRESIL